MISKPYEKSKVNYGEQIFNEYPMATKFYNPLKNQEI